MTLVIMAAGMGSRYGGVKQIDPMGPNGEIILDYSLYDAIKAGFDRVVFIIRKDIEDAFRTSIGNRFKNKIKVEYAYQELDDIPSGFSVPEGRQKPWGTCHAMLACRDQIDNPFIIINADDFYGEESFKVSVDGLRGLKNKSNEAFLIAYRLGNTLSSHGTVSRGVCQTSGNWLTGIDERLKIGYGQNGNIEFHEKDHIHVLTGDEPVSMNFWGFSPSIFDEIDRCFTAFLDKSGQELKSEFLIPSVMGDLINARKLKIKVLQSKAIWFGVTYPQDKPAVKKSLEQLIDRGLYPSSLWG